jgi:lipopolysaccharide export system permease protein
LKTLARYFLFDFIGPFLLAVAVLTFILLMDKLFLMIDLLVRKGIGVGTVGQLILLSLPPTMSISTPLAMLIAAVMSYGRASQDNELGAIRTAGIQVFRVFIPVMIAGVALAGLMVYFNGFVVADSSFKLRNLMMDMATKRPAIRVEPGVFMTDFEGYTIYIGAMNEKTSAITDVRIYDRTQAGTPDLIIAPKGMLTATPDEKYLVLTLDSGAIHQYLGGDKYRRVEFNEHVINLPFNEDLQHKDRDYRGNHEMTLTALDKQMGQLRKDAKSQQKVVHDLVKNKKGPWNQADSIRIGEEVTKLRYKQKDIDRLATETNKRWSLSFSCFLFLFFGAPLGIMLRRGGMGTGFLVGLVFFAAFYILMVGGEDLASSGKLSPFIGMWLGNIILLPVTIELCARTFLEYSIIGHFWSWVRTRILPRSRAPGPRSPTPDPRPLAPGA